MYRCDYEAQIGRCFQWGWDKDHNKKSYCFYHKRVVDGVFTPGEDYGVEMLDDE